MNVTLRKIGWLVIVTAVVVIFLFSVQDLRVDTFAPGLIAQGARIFNHSSMTLTEVTAWPTAGSREVLVAPLAALFVYLISEVLNTFLTVRPSQIQAVVLAFVFSLGMLSYLRSLPISLNRCGALLLGCLVYAALAVPVLRFDTLVYSFALLPLAYVSLYRPSMRSIWTLLLVIGVSSVCGIDAELILLLILLTLLASVDTVTPREFKIFSLILLVGALEIWFLRVATGAEAFPYVSRYLLPGSLSLSEDLYGALRGFRSINFHKSPFLALEIASAIPLVVYLRRCQLMPQAVMLAVTVILSLVCERTVLLFALFYSVALIEIVPATLLVPSEPSETRDMMSGLTATLFFFFALTLHLLLDAEAFDTEAKQIISKSGVSALASRNADQRIFNDWRLGDLLARAGYQPFIDSRLENFPAQFLQPYQELMSGDLTALRFLDTWHVNTVITADRSILCYLLQAEGSWHVTRATRATNWRDLGWVQCTRDATT